MLGKKTDLQWVVDWIGENFDVEVSIATVSRHIKAIKLTIKLVRKRGMPRSISKEQYAQLYLEDLLKLHNSGFFKHPPNLIYTIDATSNSRRLERPTTIAISGGPAPKLAVSHAVYTDTYLAALWMDGVNRTPTLMFTFNPALKPDGSRWKEVCEWCAAWDLEPEQIVYEDSAKKYCATTNEHVAHFKRIYSDRIKGTRVMYDAGNEFKFQRESILLDGADQEFVFTPATHGEESVLDNNWFAIAKKWWREEREKFCGDDVDKQSVYLVYCIDYYKSEQIQNLYTRNYLLGLRRPTLPAVEDFLGGRTRMTYENQELLKKYLAAYKAWCAEHHNETTPDVFEALEDDLDGVYWQ